MRNLSRPLCVARTGLFFYGSFILGRTHTAASNAVFDQTSRGGTPCSVRDVDDLVGEAAPHGLELREVVAMPSYLSRRVLPSQPDISRELHGRATPPAATSIDPDGNKERTQNRPDESGFTQLAVAAVFEEANGLGVEINAYNKEKWPATCSTGMARACRREMPSQHVVREGQVGHGAQMLGRARIAMLVERD